jgi:hypothetical protein
MGGIFLSFAVPHVRHELGTRPCAPELSARRLLIEAYMNLQTVLLVLLIILLLGALPTWPYSAGWGYYPSGGLGLVVIVLLILLFARRGSV